MVISLDTIGWKTWYFYKNTYYDPIYGNGLYTQLYKTSLPIFDTVKKPF